MVLMSTPASAHVLLLLMGCTGGRGGMNTYATPCGTCSKQAFARSTHTANEPMLDTLYNLLLHYKLLLSKLTDLNQLVADLIKPERAVETQFLL